jgi:hypothetical protein
MIKLLYDPQRDCSPVNGLQAGFGEGRMRGLFMHLHRQMQDAGIELMWSVRVRMEFSTPNLPFLKNATLTHCNQQPIAWSFHR